MNAPNNTTRVIITDAFRTEDISFVEKKKKKEKGKTDKGSLRTIRQEPLEFRETVRRAFFARYRI